MNVRRDSMCDYCEKGKTLNLHRRETDTNIQEIFIMKCRDDENGTLFIRQPMWTIEDDKKIRVRLTTQYAYLDIKYCPFCGKEIEYKKNDRLTDMEIELQKF
jgi:CYTH domain-containing protein